MASGKEIKSRIKSVSNTKKITRAMELISTVKMKKAQEGVVGSRPFALEALRILSKLEKTLDATTLFSGSHDRITNKDLVLVLSSNKGLCGGYNVNAFKKVLQYRKQNQTIALDFVTVGKKARDFIVRTGENLLIDFSEFMKDSITIFDTKKIARYLLKLYLTGSYDRVIVIHSYYVSAITQYSLVKSFLPISGTQIRDFLESVVHDDISSENHDDSHTIEPSAEFILEQTIPMVLDLLMYEIFLEAKASEHASRMVAMKNAKDSATKKVSSLTLTYNKARQSSITKEVSEIVSGVESMKE